jgi:type IV pilus assembly protein PilE
MSRPHCQADKHFRKRGGFTMIELVVVVVIVGILAAIALPAYQQHVVKSKRAAAQALMMDLADREQQFMLANRVFAAKSDLTAAGFSIPNNLAAAYDWDVSTVAGTPPTFTITFTPVSGGSQSADGTLSLTSEGVKAPADKW